MNKVVIVGCGNVGMAYAYALCTKKSSVDELVLIDINKQKAEGEALDLCHACACLGNHIKIKAGEYEDCNDASIICITAGRNQEVGETRRDLLAKNYQVFKSIITEINKTEFNGIYLVATNPLDTMTYITQKLSGFEPNRVIGSGTILDTSRLKFILSEKLLVNTKNVHAYVLGEHGDSEFIAWSSSLIGLNSVEEYLTKKEMEDILFDVRNSAYTIINKKGNTAYGIGVCLEEITRCVLENTKNILTVSAYNINEGLYYGTPAVIGRNGVERIMPVKLSKPEQKQLKTCLEAIRENIKSVQ